MRAGRALQETQREDGRKIAYLPQARIFCWIPCTAVLLWQGRRHALLELQNSTRYFPSLTERVSVNCPLGSGSMPGAGDLAPAERRKSG